MSDPILPREVYPGQDFYVPSFRLLVQGREAPLEMRDVISVSYSDSLANIDSFDLTVNNWDAETRDFKYSDSDTFNPWTIVLFRTVRLAHPAKATEQSAFDKWLDQTSDREAGRRDRLHGAEGIIPSSIWLVLFLIALVVFVFMLFFADSGEGAGAQAVLMGSATTVIVLTLLAINALDNPYGGAVGRLKPVAMERTLRLLNLARADLDQTAAPPCNARGAPVSS